MNMVAPGLADDADGGVVRYGGGLTIRPDEAIAGKAYHPTLP
jgi:hypothetical protein